MLTLCDHIFNLTKCTVVQAARMNGLDTISDKKQMPMYYGSGTAELMSHTLNIAAGRREMTSWPPP